MAKLSDISGGMFDNSCLVTVRIVMSADLVFRKNPGFGKQALRKSKFSSYIYKLCTLLNRSEVSQILGDVSLDNEQSIIDSFTRTNCKHYVNYHDQKLCTVEFVAKYSTTIENLLKLSDDILEQMHLEIQTPVGDVQL